MCCDKEQWRRLRTRRDCLAYFDVARDYRSVYGRNDLSIAKVGLGSMKRHLKLADGCLCVCRSRLRLLIGIARLVDGFLGNSPTLRQYLAVLEHRFGLGES